MASVNVVFVTIYIVGILCMAPSTKSYNLPQLLAGSNSQDTAGDIFNEEAFRRHLDSAPGVVLGNLSSNSPEAVEQLRSNLKRTISLIQQEQLQHGSSSNKDDQQQTHSTHTSHEIADKVMTQQECFIEIVKAEKIPGKCQKMHGLSVCQSDKYINIDATCSKV